MTSTEEGNNISAKFRGDGTGNFMVEPIQKLAQTRNSFVEQSSSKDTIDIANMG